MVGQSEVDDLYILNGFVILRPVICLHGGGGGRRGAVGGDGGGGEQLCLGSERDHYIFGFQVSMYDFQ